MTASTSSRSAASCSGSTEKLVLTRSSPRLDTRGRATAGPPAAARHRSPRRRSPPPGSRPGGHLEDPVDEPGATARPDPQLEAHCRAGHLVCFLRFSFPSDGLALVAADIAAGPRRRRTPRSSLFEAQTEWWSAPRRRVGTLRRGWCCRAVTVRGRVMFGGSDRAPPRTRRARRAGRPEASERRRASIGIVGGPSARRLADYDQRLCCNI
jgi:hypothetical protein